MSLRLATIAARAASGKTLEETLVLDVGDLIGITDHFVITGGRNDRQVRAVLDEVQKAVRDAGGKLLRSEGLDDLKWVLLDYGDFVVHVFEQEARAYYGLERLWADSDRVEFAPEGDDALRAPAARR
ncbi:MAG: ribosome silencing factor [Actinomycetota bacterium]|nr:ribosome silencing factor [Actinomycetota bacterium]